MSDDNWRIVKPLAELLLQGQPMSDEEKAQILDVLIEYADQMALLLVGR